MKKYNKKRVVSNEDNVLRRTEGSTVPNVTDGSHKIMAENLPVNLTRGDH